MIFFPAIDLKDGQCVRLYKGEMNRATVFSDNPAAQARTFQDAGAEWLHLVDLNGAFEGRSVNGEAVDAILDALDIPVELGGGVRDRETLEAWLEKGVRRVILGTAALRDPGLVVEACRAHPGRVAVGVDARDGKIAVEGWTETAGVTALELAGRFEDAGVGALIFTDISKDGAMEGPNVDATLELARSTSIPVIASGGVSSMDDLRGLKARGGGVLEGVISGRAVYDGTVDVAEAVRFLAS